MLLQMWSIGLNALYKDFKYFTCKVCIYHNAFEFACFVYPGPVCLWYSSTPQRMPEMRNFLSHLDLSLTLYELFSWLEKYFIQCENFPPGKFPNKECVLQLINEFVFNHSENSQKVRLTCWHWLISEQWYSLKNGKIIIDNK